MENSIKEYSEQASDTLAGYLLGNTLQVDLSTLAGRIAARAFAYAKEAEGNSKLADAILDRVGMEG